MTRRLPPLAALRAFEAAARLGRMTAAADELCVSPGAVSRQVRQLEQHLGLALFAGTKARPTLTAAARTLQPALTQAFEQIQEAVRSLGDAHEGPLDVACFSTFTVKWLIPRLFDFHAHHPGIEVRLRTTDTGTDAAREGCDLLITAIPTDSSGNSGQAIADDEMALPLFDEYLGPVMPPQWPGLSRGPRTWPASPCCTRAAGATPGTCGPPPWTWPRPQRQAPSTSTTTSRWKRRCAAWVQPLLPGTW